MEKKCLNCGIDMNVKPSHFDRKKYCSRSCKTQFQIKNPPEFWKKMSLKRMVRCSNCGKEPLRKPSSVFNDIFCNLECKKTYQKKNGHLINQHLKRQVQKKCPICEKTFCVPKNRESTAKYCSKLCLGKANGIRGRKDYRRRVKISCSYCRIEIEKKPSEITTYNFCSISCMGNYYAESKMFSGENSGTWSGGDINYYGPNWLAQRRKARERDRYTCQECGLTEQYGHELSVHHIKHFRDFNGDWEQANQLSNLVTLCEYPCHRKRHSKNYLVDDIV
ncbi:HNH endonuclease [Bacillus sp. JJ1609]|uniref:HNH endonuclease n=1 Tax=Bacillus sp. JJ1609 TaxID=3122977 RepID=UPI002FFF849C